MIARDDLDRVLDELVRPALDADGGGLDVVSFDGQRLVATLTGAFRGDPGSSFVQTQFLVPALRRALGDGLTITWAVARPAADEA